MKKLFMIIVTACVFFAASGLALSDQGITDTSIKVGCISDFTGIGASWGEVLKLLGNMWAKEVNSTGGIHGRKVEMMWGDNAYRPDKALSEAKRLVNFDKIFCFVGGLSTPTNIVSSEYAVKHKIPWLFPINSLKRHADRVNKYVFNLMPLHEPATRVCVDYAVSEWNAKKFGILYQYDDYGRSEMSNARDQLAKYGLKPGAVEHFKRGALEASAQVRRMRAAGCDVVNVMGNVSITASILKELKRVGWRTHFLGSIAGSSEKTVKIAGNAANGAVIPFWFNSTETHNKGMDRLRSLLKKHHPEQKLGMRHLMWSAFAALDYALKETGWDLTVENLLKTCETHFKNYNDGIIGPVTYGPDDHVGSNSVLLQVVDNGKFNKVPGWTGFIAPKK